MNTALMAVSSSSLNDDRVIIYPLECKHCKGNERVDAPAVAGALAENRERRCPAFTLTRYPGTRSACR